MSMLPHEQRIYALREEAVGLCEHCEKNISKKRMFMGCKNDPPHEYPFHECPKRIEITCIVCNLKYEAPVISYLWMKKCPICFRKKELKK